MGVDLRNITSQKCDQAGSATDTEMCWSRGGAIRRLKPSMLGVLLYGTQVKEYLEMKMLHMHIGVPDMD